MKTFLKVSLLILLTQSFLHHSSFAMDPEEERKNQEITFSAHQKIFYAKLEKLKGSISKFPSVFVSYSRRDTNHVSLVDSISQDLAFFGFPIESNRPGSGNSTHTYVDKISHLNKVILIGSSFLKQEYEDKGNVSSEVNNIRTRADSPNGLKGIIPLWFEGKFEDNFPWGISHFPARYLERKFLTDTNYLENFFELLIDIFHIEEHGESIVRDIRDKKKTFLRQRAIISEEMLAQFGAIQLEQLQTLETQDKEELAEIFGLNKGREVKQQGKPKQHQSFSEKEVSEERLTNYQSAIIQQRRVYSLVQEIKDVLKAEPDVPLNVYQAFYQRGLMGELESGSIELKDAWRMIKASFQGHFLFDVESLVERDDLEGFLHDPQASLKAEQDIQQSYFSKILSRLEHIEKFERVLSHPQQVLSATLKEAKEWVVQKVGQLKGFYQGYLTEATALIKEVIEHPDSTTVRHKLTEHLSEKAIMTGDILMGSEERFYRISRKVARTVVSVNERGEPIKKEQGGSVSNHAVSSLPKDNPRLYFKAFSSRVGLKPGNEFMMGSLYDLLNIPYPESGVLLFTNLTHNNNPPSIVMVSEGIPGKTGKQVLKESPEFFEALDQEAYEKQVLGAMLTDHGDGKADNFICLENPSRLVPIDNEEVFVPILSEDKKGLRIKSILFTLPQMETPLSTYQRSYLNSLTPQWISYMWVTEMERRNQAYQQLQKSLSFQMLKQQYQTVNMGAYRASPQDTLLSHYKSIQPLLTTNHSFETHCYLFPETFSCERHEPSPLLSILSLPLPITEERFRDTTERIGRMQLVLRDHRSASLQDLLDGIQPLIGAYYQKLRNTKKVSNTQKIDIKGALTFLYGIDDSHQQNAIETFLGGNTSIQGLSVTEHMKRLQSIREEKGENPAVLQSSLRQNIQINDLLLKSLIYLREGYFPIHSYIRDLEQFREEGLRGLIEGEEESRVLRDLWVKGQRVLSLTEVDHLGESSCPSVCRVWNEAFQELRPLSPSLDWFMIVEENFISRDLVGDKSTSFLIEGGWMRKRFLSLTIAKEIIDKQGQLKKDESLSGRSVVRGYPKEKPLFYFKAYPEFPGYEHGATSFMRKLGIKGIPYSDLVIFRPGEKAVNTTGASQQVSSSIPSISAATKSSQPIQSPYPVLLTQAVEGDILKKHWDKPLTNLDFEHTSRLIIASMLINPEDGKEDNFILSPDGRYLIPIDNDHVFLPGATRTMEGVFVKKVNTTLQGKTILYCLDEMKRSLLPETVEFIKSINVDLFLSGWLEDLATANEKYQNLVRTEDNLALHFFKKGTVLRIPLDPEFINNLYWKFHQLQDILTYQHDLPLIEILKRIEPYVGKRYGEVLASPQHRTLENRFKELTKNLYKTDVRGNHISVLNSRAMMEIMHVPESEVTGRVHNIKQGPTAALAQLDGLRTESQRQEWKAYLEHGREPTAIDGGKAGEEQAYIDSLMRSKTQPEIIVIHHSQRLYSTGIFSNTDHLTPLLDHDRGTRLKLIDLRNSYIDTRAIQIISTLAPNLEILNVSGCRNLEGIQGLKAGERLQFPTLRRLLINSCSQLTTLFIDAPLLQLIETSENPNLQNFSMNTPELMELQLGDNNIQSEGLKSLSRILPNTKVTRLGNSWQEIFLALFIPGNEYVMNLDLWFVSNAAIKELAIILPQTKITDLSLGDIGVEGIETLATVLPRTKITWLNLRWTRVGNEIAKTLAAVLPQTKITSLYLEENNIGVEGIKELIAVLPQTSIEVLGNSWQENILKLFLSGKEFVTNLNLDNKKIGVEGIKVLAAVLPQTEITSLRLRNNNIGDDEIDALGAILQQNKITMLTLDYNNIRSQGVETLATVLPDTKITSLNLNNNNIGADGIKILAAVLPQTNVTSLLLSSNIMGIKGIKQLVTTLPQSKITELHLDNNNINKEGTQTLADILPRTQITSLHLSSNNMRDEGIKALVAVLPQTQITSLNLRNNNIGDEGIKALASVLPQTKITWLNLDSNNIGAEGKALLKTLKKQLKIDIYY